MEVRHVVLGMLLGISLVGCAGFSYRYYGLSASSYEGSLLGPEPKDDKPFSLCSPTAQDKSPCVVLFSDEFFKLKQDLLETKERLKSCEEGQ